MNAEEAATLISKIVSEAGEILGARLAQVLREKAPDWDASAFKCSGLRSFIGQYVPNVSVCGRSGMDYVYRRTPKGEAGGSASTPDFWRAWVSPNGRYMLVVDRDTGNVTAQPRTAPVSHGLVRLEPPSVGVHQEIAREFLKKTDADGKLEALIVPDKPAWWQAWYSALKTNGLSSEWNAFRRSQLLTALQQRLAELQLAPPAKSAAEAKISIGHPPSQPQRKETATSKHTGSLSRLRSIAIRVIGLMDEEDIRALRLPLGLVSDVEKEKR